MTNLNKKILLQEELNELITIEELKNETFGFIEENIKSKLNYKKDIKELENNINKIETTEIKHNKNKSKNTYYINRYYRQKRLKKILSINYRVTIKEDNNKLYITRFPSISSNTAFYKNQSVKKVRRLSNEITNLNNFDLDVYNDDLIIVNKHFEKKLTTNRNSIKKNYNYWNSVY